MKPNAQTKHFASFEPTRAEIVRHDSLRAGIVEALRLQVIADHASGANLAAVLAGENTTETQAALDEAIQSFTAFRGGVLCAVFFFIQSPIEDLTYVPADAH